MLRAIKAMNQEDDGATAKKRKVAEPKNESEPVNLF